MKNDLSPEPITLEKGLKLLSNDELLLYLINVHQVKEFLVGQAPNRSDSAYFDWAHSLEAIIEIELPAAAELRERFDEMESLINVTTGSGHGSD